jgi:hypothetical protein
VTRAVGEISGSEVEQALETGAACARKWLAAGLIDGAALRLNGRMIVVAAKSVEATDSSSPLRKVESTVDA